MAENDGIDDDKESHLGFLTLIEYLEYLVTYIAVLLTYSTHSI
jgi:hypothetical protein